MHNLEVHELLDEPKRHGDMERATRGERRLGTAETDLEKCSLTKLPWASFMPTKVRYITTFNRSA